MPPAIPDGMGLLDDWQRFEWLSGDLASRDRRLLAGAHRRGLGLTSSGSTYVSRPSWDRLCWRAAAMSVFAFIPNQTTAPQITPAYSAKKGLYGRPFRYR